MFVASSRFSVAILQNLDGMTGFFQRHLAGTDNLRVVSIILLLFAFLLFLFLIIILYIKSLLNFIRDESSAGGIEVRAGKVYDNLSRERDLERELADELEKSQQRQAQQLRTKNNIQAEQERQKKAELELEKNSRRRKNRYARAGDAFEMNEPFADYRVGGQRPVNNFAGRGGERTNGFNPNADFDWRGSGIGELDNAAAGISPFPYQQRVSLDAMPGLILNMLSRNIDAAKIAQVVKSKCEGSVTEEDVIQLVDSVRNYVALCNNGKISLLSDNSDLPTAEETLYELAHNDPTYCLHVLQALMNNTLDRISSVKIPQKRDLAFMEASNYACTFGTLAALYDQDMSLSSYEMAIEFSPKNVNAWSRVGDLYARTQADSKAIWAYQNVLKMADADHHLHQIANANQHLAQYYYDQGDTLQATRLYNSSQDYYSAIGINSPLTNNEREVVKIIESKQETDVSETIGKLLKNAAQRQRGYA